MIFTNICTPGCRFANDFHSHSNTPFVDFVATTVSIGKMWLFWCSLHKRDDQYSLKTLLSLPQFQCSTFLSSPVLHISAMKWAVYTFPRLTIVPKKLFKVSSLFNFVSFIQSTNTKIRAPHLNVLTTIFICVCVCVKWQNVRRPDQKKEAMTWRENRKFKWICKCA